MIDANALIGALPRMMSGNDLMDALKVMPEYDSGVCSQDEAMRLMRLSDLYDIYLPSAMSVEVYSKLYLALIRSLQKKGSRLAVRQSVENYKAVKQRDYSGILGGSDSFTIIGTSGIGKSSAISKAIRLISENRVIEMEQPYAKIVPCVVVQCPFDSSVKGLLLEILRQVDEELDTKYYDNAVRARATTDMLIGSVSQVALNHIGLLVVDEIQHVANSKNGKALVGSLTQLINCSGISICMVGTPDSCQFFEQAMQLARRSLGLHYSELPYDGYFREFCETLYGYQYVKYQTEITEAIIEWLYEHSAGVISIVVSLIHDAQEIAILNRRETLDIVALSEAYQRMQMIHSYVRPKARTPQASKPKEKKPVEVPVAKRETKEADNISIVELVAGAKRRNYDVVEVFWKMDAALDKGDDGELKVKQFPILKYYHVFHVDQCDGIEPKYKEPVFTPLDPITEADAVLRDYSDRCRVPIIHEKGNRAFYRPCCDEIHLPLMEQFTKQAEYYSTAFHESVHSTGHKSRLNRLDDNVHFGNEIYSKEELVAEMGAATILHELGIETDSSFRNSAAYIQNWLHVLKDDPRMVVSAAGKAEKAVKLILNLDRAQDEEGHAAEKAA